MDCAAAAEKSGGNEKDEHVREFRFPSSIRHEKHGPQKHREHCNADNRGDPEQTGVKIGWPVKYNDEI